MNPLHGSLALGFLTLLVGTALAAALTLSERDEVSPQIVVKLIDGLEIHLSEGRLSGRVATSQVGQTLQGKELNQKILDQGLLRLNSLLHDASVARIEPLFSNQAAGLVPEGRQSASRDLRLYFNVVLREVSDDEANRLVDKFRELPIVEAAYRAPVPEDARDEIPVH